MKREGFARLPPASFDDIGRLGSVKERFQFAGHRSKLCWHETNRAAFISIKGPELMNKWVGE
jgi:SpoVK/Ycf46/Vps4 family AAA+-type ATPase